MDDYTSNPLRDLKCATIPQIKTVYQSHDYTSRPRVYTSDLKYTPHIYNYTFVNNCISDAQLYLRYTSYSKNLRTSDSFLYLRFTVVPQIHTCTSDSQIHLRFKAEPQIHSYTSDS